MPDTFKAATWNVFHGTDPKELRPIAEKLKEDNVSIVLGQELSAKENRDVLFHAGYNIFFHPRQYVVAWLPLFWTEINSKGMKLSDTAYFADNESGHQFSEAAMSILCDKQGRSLTAMSYHIPSGIQVANPPANRMQATRESAATWKRIADAAKTDACLFGGDDNVDERMKFGPWDFMLKKSTGLKQVQAPSATHGKHRKIDDFRIRGLTLEGPGEVRDGGGDHKLFIQKFGWA